MNTRKLIVLLCVIVNLLPVCLLATPTTAASKKALIVPDRFLRRWDPVTVFFTEAVGPKGGAPEDQANHYMSLTPEHPGAFRWLDEHTLQFRPAEPWPPLQIFAVKTKDQSLELETLMAVPKKMEPYDGQSELAKVDSLRLTFPEPISAKDLARVLTIEIRPLPGVEGRKARWITASDYHIKTFERTGMSQPATYEIQLKDSIPLGVRAIVHLRLSLRDKSAKSLMTYSFKTAQPFRVTKVGTRWSQYPVSPEGTIYTKNQAIAAGNSNRMVTVSFSSRPAELGPVIGRNLVRFSPAVDKLSYSVSGSQLHIRGQFRPETLYRVSILPVAVKDVMGRTLEMKAPSEFWCHFSRKPNYLNLTTGHGLLERYGPKMIPLEGRGDERVDLRIHKIDELSRTFWPFPNSPVTVDEMSRPPGPGEEPSKHTAAASFVSRDVISRHIKNLGSPDVSRIVTLPLNEQKGAANFGLDLSDHIQKPGTYLVGIRRLDSSTRRFWLRLQITDLCLTTVEETGGARIFVSSISTGKPVAGARVLLQGVKEGANSWTPPTFATLYDGVTGSDGSYFWKPQSEEIWRRMRLRRIVVKTDDDSLVLDPTSPPKGFKDNYWGNRGQWLSWRTRGAKAKMVAHLFTERPIYRPDEAVHIKGWLRERHQGRLRFVKKDTWLRLRGPGGKRWNFQAPLNEHGSLYHKFKDKKLPTGYYSVYLEDKKGHRFASTSFKMEEYRIPRFEVSLHGPNKVPLDNEFKVKLTAKYYAGGRVAERPVRWRVTQFPSAWTPKAKEGFYFSSDSRYSSVRAFSSTGSKYKEGKTDIEGGADISLDPAIEPTAQPRTYVVEATVVGADDMTVTATHRVRALPAFVLGLKVPRIQKKAGDIPAEVLVLDHEGEFLPEQKVKVRLLHRQWHAHLRAGDFSSGEVKYQTDVVDEKIYETELKSGKEAIPVKLPAKASGVYIVELESHDRQGRAQTVSVDLYVSGDTAVTWRKPEGKKFAISTDKSAYEPGEKAQFVLKSPFQDGRALVVIEEPEHNRYEWLVIKGGAATFTLPVRETYVPRVPLHFILWRGRVNGAKLNGKKLTDLGKPATVASTKWVTVKPVRNRVTVKLDNPEKALPGQTIEVNIDLSDEKGEALSGEVTLWLVDQAVLALAPEGRLDPVPDFITSVSSYILVRDTRSMTFGFLPFTERPGGDYCEGEECADEASLMDKVTVRKRFETVPFYNPNIIVGPSGKKTIKVLLPDNLTNFKLRAKAVSGPSRFGFATGQVSVRLPLIVQPSLPRFVRPGDKFSALAIGRVVEGDGGPGLAQISAQGLTVSGDNKMSVTWEPPKAQRVSWNVIVPTPPLNKKGEMTRREVSVKVAVRRMGDGAMDAFQVSLPIKEDRKAITEQIITTLKKNKLVKFPAVEEEARPGTIKRKALVSTHPALVRMAAGLDMLMAFPHDCTEQRVSRAHVQLAMEGFRELLFMDGPKEEMEQAVKETVAYIPKSLDGNGLCAYWPGGEGSVSLTSWVVQFLADVRKSGYPIDEKAYDKMLRGLERSLRSDCSWLVDGHSWLERCWALIALTDAGRSTKSWSTELARKSQYLDAEARANVVLAFVQGGDGRSSMVSDLTEELWNSLLFRLHQGKRIYGGFQDRALGGGPVILSSETRSLARLLRALQKVAPKDKRVELLRAALINLGQGDGWGSTNANSAALLALQEALVPTDTFGNRAKVVFKGKDLRDERNISEDSPTLQQIYKSEDDLSVVLKSADTEVIARLETSYLPAGDGSTVKAKAKGFAVTRDLLRVAFDEKSSSWPALGVMKEPYMFEVGQTLEERVQVVNAKQRHYVAVVIPLAAGFEPLNPRLATAPPEAKPSGSITLKPTYAAYRDDHVAFYYDTLHKGTYTFVYRVRATTPGTFIQPAAWAEMMYRQAVRGNSKGAKVKVMPALK